LGGGVFLVRTFDPSNKEIADIITYNDLETEDVVTGILNTHNLSPKSLAIIYIREPQVMSVFVLDEKEGSPMFLFSSDYIIDGKLMEICYKTFKVPDDTEYTEYIENLVECYLEFLFVINSNGSPVSFQIKGKDPRILARQQRIRHICKNLKQKHELDPQ
jgi:hypothetical protein